MTAAALSRSPPSHLNSASLFHSLLPLSLSLLSTHALTHSLAQIHTQLANHHLVSFLPPPQVKITASLSQALTCRVWNLCFRVCVSSTSCAIHSFGLWSTPPYQVRQHLYTPDSGPSITLYSLPGIRSSMQKLIPHRVIHASLESPPWPAVLYMLLCNFILHCQVVLPLPPPSSPCCHS